MHRLKLAYIILAHRDPDHVVRLAMHLVEAGGFVAIHYDLKSPDREFMRLRELLKGRSDVLFVERNAIGWGQWSIVRATLNAIAAIERTKIPFDYVHLMSGMDYPIRPPEWLATFLARKEGTEFIEVTNIRKKSWVRGGLEHERYEYKHIHNWQFEPKKFERYWKRQKACNRKREFLPGMDPYLGSQWWTLTWSTCLGALRWSNDPNVCAFFEAVWIPDEMFFQTYVGNNVAPSRIANLALVFYQFDDMGIPVTYYNDHLDYLLKRKFFFARKLSPGAEKLRDGIDAYLSKLRHCDIQLDLAVGERTTEYSEIIARHRWGLENSRRIGYSDDPWYGDLEWNRDAYLVISSGSREQGERVREAIATLSSAICHGELFAESQIEFADGRERFAGYGMQDIRLRDQKRSNFLVDVIKAGLPALTSFVFVVDNSEIQEILIFDARAHFIVVQVNVVEAFFEWWRKRVAVVESDASLAENVEFASFANKFLAERALQLPALQTKLTQAGKQAHVIESFAGDWQRKLWQFVLTLVNSDAKKGSGNYLTPLDTKKEDKVDVSRVFRLISIIPDVSERDRLLYNHFSPVEDSSSPYLAVFASSASEAGIASLLPRLLPNVEWFVMTYSPTLLAAKLSTNDAGRGAAEGSSATPGLRETYTIACRRYRLARVEAIYVAPLVSMIVWDPRASVLMLRGEPSVTLANLIANDREVAADAVSPKDRELLLGAIADGLMQFYRGLRDFGQMHRKKVAEIDFGDTGWFTELNSFVQEFAIRNRQAAIDTRRLNSLMREVLTSNQRVGGPDSPLASYRPCDIEPYLVVAATSATAVKRVSAALSGLSFVACHGELFGPQRIGFLDERQKFGQHAAADVVTRDQNPLKFLSETIEAGAPALTAFRFVIQEGSELADQLIFDPRAQFIVVTVDVVEAFMEETRRSTLGQVSPSANGNVFGSDETVQFQAFARKSLARDAGLRSSLVEKLLAVGKQPLQLDEMDEDWIERAILFAAEIAGSYERSQRSSLRVITRRAVVEEGLPKQKRDLRHILRLVGAIPASTERDRQLYHYFNPAGKDVAKYSLAFVLSKADEQLLATMARAIPRLELVVVRYAPSLVGSAEIRQISEFKSAKSDPAFDALSSLQTGQLESDDRICDTAIMRFEEVYSISCKRYHIDKIEPAHVSPLLNLLVQDPRSQILLVHGNAFAPLADLVRSYDGTAGSGKSPTVLQRWIMAGLITESDDFFSRVRALATAHNKSTTELDLLAPNWFSELMSFVNATIDGSVVGLIDEEEIGALLKEELQSAPDPAILFADPLELTEMITPMVRRIAHQRVIRTMRMSNTTDSEVKFGGLAERS